MEEGFTLTPIPPNQLPTFDEFWDDLKEDARLYLDKDDSIYEKGTHGIPPRPAKTVEYVYKHGGRLGSPAEVARLLVFLAGEDAGYITGQVFGVNGGLVI